MTVERPGKAICLILCALYSVLPGCSLTRDGALRLSSLADYRSLASDSELRLFSVTSGLVESEYAGTLQVHDGTIELPGAIQSEISSRMAAAPVHYVIKSFAASVAASGDAYFETPVLSSTLELNGAATALWTAIKLSVKSSGSVLNIDRATWDDLLFVLEAACPDCQNTKTSDVWAMIRTDAGLQSQVNDLLSQLTPPVQLVQSVLDSPPIQVARSLPVSVEGATTAESAAEGSTMSFQTYFYAPDLSVPTFVPSTWTHSAPVSGDTIFATQVGDASRFIDFVASGSNTITADASLSDGRADSLVFTQTVSNVDLAPAWLSIPAQAYIANHRKTLNLAAYGQDPDGDPVTFTLVSGPPGVSLTASILEWNPTQAPDTDQLGLFEIKVKVSSTTLQAIVTIHADVTEDHMPSFDATTPVFWNLSEGTSGTFNLTSEDSDADPLVLNCVSGCNQLESNRPTGAGWPSTYVYGGAAGAQTAAITYMPSYMETIGANATRSVVLALSYDDTADPNLRQITPIQHALDLNITNVDDPPSWTAGGTQLTENHTGGSALTENAAFTATTPFLAVDPSPGATAITYTLAPLPTYCTWITMDPATRIVSGTPTYASPANCAFQIRATDGNGLVSDSPPITYAITDINRVPAPSGTVPNQTISEGQTLTLNLNSAFTDPDWSVGDPRESVGYTCTGCPAGATISGVTLSYKPAYSVSSGAPVAFNGVQITATDKGGATASQSFDITVNQAIGPPTLALSSGTLTLAAGQVTRAESDAAGNVVVGVGFNSGDTPYTYDLAVTCLPSCTGSLVSLPVSSGSTATNYNLTIQPSATDGDGGPASSQKIYTVTVTGTKQGTALTSTQTFDLTITNVNRAPTAVIVAGSNATTTYAFTVDGSIYSANTRALGTADPDGGNDAYTYSFVTSTYASVGTISGANWAFNPLQAGCLTGSDTVVKTFDIKSIDNRGGLVIRRLQMTVTNAQTGAGGSCPY
jgi:hypothetical protein